MIFIVFIEKLLIKFMSIGLFKLVEETGQIKKKTAIMLLQKVILCIVNEQLLEKKMYFFKHIN